MTVIFVLNGSLYYPVGYYNYKSVWPYYIVISQTLFYHLGQAIHAPVIITDNAITDNYKNDLSVDMSHVLVLSYYLVNNKMFKTNKNDTSKQLKFILQFLFLSVFNILFNIAILSISNRIPTRGQ